VIIDAHNHPDWLGHSFQKCRANMTQYGIEKTWLLSWEAPGDEYNPSFSSSCPQLSDKGPIAFARCVRYAEQSPESFILGYAPDPRRPESIDLLAAAVETYGVRVYGELKLRMMYDNPDALRMFRFCGEKRLPVMLHIDYESKSGRKYPRPSWWYGGGLEALERAVRACPETTFLGHGPGFWCHISGDCKHRKESYPQGPVVPGGKLPTLLRECPNLCCDTSAQSGLNALKRDPAFAKDFLVEFQDRVFFGRGCFDNALHDVLNGLNLPPDVLDKICSGNALELIPLE